MPAYAFDDRNIKWKTYLDLEHLVLSILNIDEENRILHVLFKFDADKKILLHRHKVLNKLWVIQGEHRFYHPNGDLKEVRSVGSYTVSPPSDDAHREGGGAGQDVIILFTIYGEQEVLYEALDDDMNVVAEITYQDLLGLYDRPTKKLTELAY